MKTRPDSIMEQFKNFVRQPYAWPGGYPLFCVTHDGGILCKKCAEKHAKSIISEIMQGCRTGWHITAVDVNWEDTNLCCDNCGRNIESAYGEETA